MELISLPLVLLLISNIHSEQTEDITPTLTVQPQTSVFIGDLVTLTCEIHQSTGWEFFFITPSNTAYTETTGTKTIRSVQVSDGGEYKCRARKENPQVYTQYSEPITVTVQALPRVAVSVTPDRSVFTGETITLKCEIENQYRSLNWRYLWYKDTTEVFNSERYTVNRDSLTITGVSESDRSGFRCSAEIHGRPQTSLSSSAVYLTVKALPRATVRVTPDRSVFTGETVTLKCEIEDQYSNWRYVWYKGRTGTSVFVGNIYTIISPSDQDEFWCRGERDGRPSSSQYSDHVTLSVKGSKPKLTSDTEGSVLTERPKPVVSVDPDTQLFRGETVTLRCDIQDTGDTEWTYSWTVEPYNLYRWFSCETQECKINNIQHTNSGKYTCRGKIREHNTEMSDAVTLTVSSDKPQTVLSVSPQQWLTEGDSVTLMCEVINSSTDWTFTWFTVQSPSSVNRDVDYELVSNSSGGSKGIYTVSSVTVKHTGVYMCRAERGDPVYHTYYSNTQTLWITGVSPSVSLIIRPNRSQHFSSESLSLSCEDHSNSTGWKVRRYTDKLKPCSSSDWRSTGTTSTCTIRYLYTSDTGVYWCQSESGEKLHPINISVHYVDVILDSPVHPVTEGDLLTLHCLYRDKNPSNLRAEFYKDGSLVQNQTTGDMMIIPTVSKSHEGFYYCKHPERGESPKSWISVRENTSEGDDTMNSKLKKGEDQDVASGSSDVTNAQTK